MNTDHMNNHYLSAFKAYDIRWIYQKDIDNDFSYILGRAISTYISDTYPKNNIILIGCDPRAGNIGLIDAFTQALDEKWIQWHIARHDTWQVPEEFVYGICSSSVLYYLGKYYPLGVSFTASHNPAEYVGMKFFDNNGRMLSPELLKELWLHEYEKSVNKNYSLRSREHSIHICPNKRVIELDSLLMKSWEKIQHKHSFAVDYAHGAACGYEKYFLQNKIGRIHQILHIHDKPDMDKIGHGCDTSDVGNYEELLHVVKKNNLDFGVLFDGDADRIGIVTKTGKVLWGDILTAIIASAVLCQYPGNDTPLILYDCMSTHAIPHSVHSYGGRSAITRIWRYFINQELHAQKALFAGELSGHFLFAEIGGYEMPLLALMYFLYQYERFDSLDSMLSEYVQYYKSPLMNFSVENVEAVLTRIQEAFHDSDIQILDGLHVYGDEFWFTIRPSQTEPKLRLVIEANTSHILEQITKRVQNLILWS
jgi:phosphomannomutase